MNPDSIYQPVERAARKFKTLQIPTKLEEALPFASKPKNGGKLKREGYIGNRAVVMDMAEKKRQVFVQAMNTIRNEKEKIRKQRKQLRSLDKAKENKGDEQLLAAARKANKKRQYRAEGKREKQREVKRLKHAEYGQGPR